MSHLNLKGNFRKKFFVIQTVRRLVHPIRQIQSCTLFSRLRGTFATLLVNLMFSDRSSHQNGSRCNHHRGIGSHGNGHGGCSDGRRDGGLNGRSSPFNSRHGHCGRDGDQIGYGREGRVRLDDAPFLEWRRGSLGGLGPMGGVGGMGGLGGLGGMGGWTDSLGGIGGLGGGPRGMMAPLGSSSRGSPMIGHRMPLGHDPLLGGGRMMGMGPMMSPLVSRDSLLGRGAMMPLGLGMGPGSRPGSIRSGGSVRGMELARLGMGRGPGNYRPPYVEDYESEIDEFDREQFLDYLERGGHPDMFGDYIYGPDIGGMRGGLF